jgi:protein SCO1/2
LTPRPLRWLLPLAFAALVAAPGPAAAQVIDSSTPVESPLPPLAREAGIDERLGERVPLDVALTDSEGRAVTVGDLLAAGKPVALVFAYHSCPMLCSVVLDGFAASIRETALVPGEDYLPVTVSFDPRDTPARAAEVKARYVQQAARPEAAAWRFLTGDEGETRRLADAVGFEYARDARSGEYAHAAALILLTPDGRVARYLYGAGFPDRDFRLALVEAGEGRTGTTLDRFVLTCYRYDPDARSYIPFAMGMMKLGGAALLVALAAVLVPLWRREVRRRDDGEAPSEPEPLT